MRYYKEDLDIQELMGAPRAYMEIPTEFGVIRFVYKTLQVRSKEWGKLVQINHEVLESIRDQLASMTGGPGIIWWRRKPEFSHDGDYYHWSCRLETSPQILNEEFWRKVYWTSEGLLSQEIV